MSLIRKKDPGQAWATASDADTSGFGIAAVFVTAEQILHMNEQSVEIMPAPGDEKAILPLWGVGQFDFVTTQYANAGYINIIYAGQEGDQAPSLGFQFKGLSEAPPTEHAILLVSNVDPEAAIPESEAINKPLVLSMQGQNPTEGDGVILFFVLYLIITV